jgi:hypothetical protein
VNPKLLFDVGWNQQVVAPAASSTDIENSLAQTAHTHAMEESFTQYRGISQRLSTTALNIDSIFKAECLRTGFSFASLANTTTLWRK